MVINHLLGHPDFPVVSTGGTHSRLERVAFLADHPELLTRLRVCYQPTAGGGNCSRCEKCVRTQLELRAAGITTEPMFPLQVRADDIWDAHVNNPTVLGHFVDIARALPADDPLRPVVEAWVDRERLDRDRRSGGPLSRIASLEAELAAAQHEIDELRSSRSWRMTAPLRAASERLAR